MKAIISSTYDPKYLYFIPIVTYCWNRIGVDVICFIPKLTANADNNKKIDLLLHTIRDSELRVKLHEFEAPENKQPTYSQCSRLFGACLDLPDDEILVMGDVDMANFQVPPFKENGFTVYGADLVPKGQYPICYVSGSVKTWRDAFNLYYKVWEGEQGQMVIGVKTYQQALDELLGGIECENMRGNFWAKDQEECFLKVSPTNPTLVKRTNGITPFATRRIDRDDSFWEERLNLDVVDAHLWRDGLTDENFAKIMKLLQYFYPYDNFQWLIDYTEKFKQLL